MIPGTLALGVLAVVASLGMVGGSLVFDRTLIDQGEWWRLLSGHFVHFSGAHLAADLAGWILLGGLLERRAPWLWRAVVISSLVLIGPGLWKLEPTLTLFGGLSGMVHAMAAALAACWISSDSGVERGRGWVLLVGMAWKLGWIGWFPDTGSGGVLPSGVSVCHASHALGMMLGFGSFLAVGGRWSRPVRWESGMPLKWMICHPASRSRRNSRFTAAPTRCLTR